MRKIFIHIGMHRAQSTSLQYALNFIANLPGEALFYYPQSGKSTPVGELGGHELFVDSSNNAVNKNILGLLLEEIELIPKGIPVILSSEEFWRLNPSDLQCFTEYFEVNPVCIERDFFSWVMSVWSLTVVSGEVNATPIEFLDYVANDIQNSKVCSFYDIDKKMMEWKEVYGDLFIKLNYPLDAPHIDIIKLFTKTWPEDWSQLRLHVNQSSSIEEILNITAQQNYIHMVSQSITPEEISQTICHYESLFNKKIQKNYIGKISELLSIQRKQT